MNKIFKDNAIAIMDRMIAKDYKVAREMGGTEVQPISRCFLAMFENGNKPFYLADWEGDPGRTLLKENAKQFRTKALAEKAIKEAQQKYPQRNLVGKVIEYNAR